MESTSLPGYHWREHCLPGHGVKQSVIVAIEPLIEPLVDRPSIAPTAHRARGATRWLATLASCDPSALCFGIVGGRFYPKDLKSVNNNNNNNNFPGFQRHCFKMAAVAQGPPNKKRRRTVTCYSEMEGLKRLKFKLRRALWDLGTANKQPPAYVHVLLFMWSLPHSTSRMKDLRQHVGKYYNMVQSCYMGVCFRTWNSNGAMHIMEFEPHSGVNSGIRIRPHVDAQLAEERELWLACKELVRNVFEDKKQSRVQSMP